MKGPYGKFVASVSVILSIVGCASSDSGQKTASASPSGRRPRPQAHSQPTANRASDHADWNDGLPRGLVPPYTHELNPTSVGGRGEPSLEDQNRPAAWIFVDGKPGKFIERNGHPQLQWVVENPVRAMPTFRVEAYEPLLGDPKDFFCALQTYESADGSKVLYAFRADEGSFQTGVDYPLLSPGPNFTILDKVTNESLTSIPPLSPGTYALAAGVRNAATGKEGLAVTYFTVGNEDR